MASSPFDRYQPFRARITVSSVNENLKHLSELFEREALAGNAPALENFLEKVATEQRDALLTQLIPIYIQYALDSGQDLVPDSFAKYGKVAVEKAQEVLTNATNKRLDADSRLQTPASAKTLPAGMHSDEESTSGFEVDPECIGPYRLTKRIGRGGMGAVWKAEQMYPVVRRVAIKLIRRDLDADDAIARFEVERQAISRMDHPNIARILDAGNAEDGRPYFVMELVQGMQIDRFCDEKRLTIRQRIELVISVCKAIQHAHQKGIIHRDLKPSNVLVTDVDGVNTAKVIDFGVAKAVRSHRVMHDSADLTAHGQVVGTLQYMSPEQSQGQYVDTRTDIYGLGALLYRLLTGSLPISDVAVRSGSVVTYAEQLKHHDAPKPSSRFLDKTQVVREVCDARQTTPDKLRQELRGDLDWIVCKAVERERELRYETAQELAADLEHYLNDEEVEARPPSAIYRFRKFVRRNQLAVASLTTILLLLICGIFGIGYLLSLALESGKTARANETLALDEAARAKRAEEKSKELQERGELVLHAVSVKSAWNSWRLGDAKNAWKLIQKTASNSGWETRYLQSEFNMTSQILYGHTGQVMAVAASADGKLLATGGLDEVIRVWDAETYELLESHIVGQPVSNLLFAPNSNQIVGATTDRNLLTIADPLDEEPEVASTSEPFLRDIETLLQTRLPDGTNVLVVGESHLVSDRIGIHWNSREVGPASLRILRRDDFSEMQVLEGHQVMVSGLVYSPERKLLISTDLDGVIKTWEANSNGQFQEAESRQQHFGIMHAILMPDGKHLAVACSDLVIRIMDTRTWNTTQSFVGHRAQIRRLAVSPRGDRIASVSVDRTARVWKNDGALFVECLGHLDVVADICFFDDGKQIATASDDATAAIWSASSRPGTHRHRPFSELAWSADFSADGSRIVAVSEEGGIQLFSSRDLSLLAKKETDLEILTTAFSPNANVLVHAGIDGVLTLRDGSNLEILDNVTAHETYIWDVNYSEDGNYLVTAGTDMLARIWNTEDWSLEQELEGHTAELASACFSHDGSFVVTAGDDRTVRLWSTENGEELHVFEGHKSAVWRAVVSPDDSTIVSSGFDGEVFVWDVEKRTERHHIQAHRDQIAGLCISNDGQRFVTACDDGTIRFWDMEKPLEIFELGEPKSAPVVHASFSPDGRMLITGNAFGGLTLRHSAPAGQFQERFLPEDSKDFANRMISPVRDEQTTRKQLKTMLEQADRCAKHFPGYEVMTIKGIAEFRLGQLDASILSLTEAARLRAFEYRDPDIRPYIEAYLCFAFADRSMWEEAKVQSGLFKEREAIPPVSYDSEIKALSLRIDARMSDAP